MRQAAASAMRQAAAPAMRKTKRPAQRDARVEAIRALILESLDQDKALDVVVVSLAGKSSIADYMVIASGTSQRHVGAVAEHLRERLKAAGHSVTAPEGLPACDWVLLDAGDAIVHIFKPEVRAFYNLEKMWSVDLPAETVGAP